MTSPNGFLNITNNIFVGRFTYNFYRNSVFSLWQLSVVIKGLKSLVQNCLLGSSILYAFTSLYYVIELTEMFLLNHFYDKSYLCPEFMIIIRITSYFKF